MDDANTARRRRRGARPAHGRITVANGAASASGPRGMGVVMRRLAGYARGQRLPLALGIFLFFASSAIDPVVPALFKWLIDNGFKAGANFPLWPVPLVVIGLFFVRGLLGFGGAYLFARATSNTVLKLRTDLIQAVIRADANLYSHMSPGVVASRVILDPQNAVNALAGAMTTLLRDGTTLIALLGYLFYLNWQLTLLSLITIPLLALVVKRVQKRVLVIAGQSYESQVRLIGIVDDIARAWRVVRTFGAAGFESRRFYNEALHLRRVTLKSITAGATMTPLTQIVASAGVALIVTAALADAGKGGTTVGEFVAFVTTLLMTISPMRHLTDVTQPIIGGLVQARACFDLIDTPAEPDNGKHEMASSRGEICIERLGVVYPGAERPALKGVSMTIPAGQVVALVGPSGSGKSTLVSAMLAFVAPSEGRVLLDGHDIGGLRKASLRRQFAVVSQDIVLFDGSIDDNVVYAQRHDSARIEASLRAADLWHYVSDLPERGATRIGTNGARLSGGQRQRLAIARALYKDASVWIFDEATSALDSASERLVHEAIERWRGRRTMVLVAHRLSTVRHADRIYVVADGQIAEAGRHGELVEHGGLYAGMVDAQLLSRGDVRQ